MDDRQITREVVLPAGPDEVWEHMADAEALSAWFEGDLDGEVASGELLTYTTPLGAERRAIVEEVAPTRRLVFRWLPGERGADGRMRRRESSRVVIDLEPFGDSTVMRVAETRVGSAGTPLPDIGFRAMSRR